MSESHFHVSEEKSQEVALSVASLWNSAVKTLKTLCKGNDWVLFLKVFQFSLVLSEVVHSQLFILRSTVTTAMNLSYLSLSNVIHRKN